MVAESDHHQYTLVLFHLLRGCLQAAQYWASTGNIEDWIEPFCLQQKLLRSVNLFTHTAYHNINL